LYFLLFSSAIFSLLPSSWLVVLATLPSSRARDSLYWFMTQVGGISYDGVILGHYDSRNKDTKKSLVTLDLSHDTWSSRFSQVQSPASR
jgi:hypothetical protein